MNPPGAFPSRENLEASPSAAASASVGGDLHTEQDQGETEPLSHQARRDSVPAAPAAVPTVGNLQGKVLFPEARIRALMRHIPEVKRYTRDAGIVLNKATELYLLELSRCVETVHMKSNPNRTSVASAADLAAATEVAHYAAFLEDVFVDPKASRGPPHAAGAPGPGMGPQPPQRFGPGRGGGFPGVAPSPSGSEGLPHLVQRGGRQAHPYAQFGAAPERRMSNYAAQSPRGMRGGYGGTHGHSPRGGFGPMRGMQGAAATAAASSSSSSSYAQGPMSFPGPQQRPSHHFNLDEGRGGVEDEEVPLSVHLQSRSPTNLAAASSSAMRARLEGYPGTNQGQSFDPSGAQASLAPFDDATS
uniref:Transcription factor CBF/NF-Y/archaeal histone domain-containing protein n=1 Tax=Chromera velia CCMP2878 TaxID=1169474 RepID=A0A0G4F0R4_9ALVE|eukprot:Cvel_2556.t1-p1 / transcript=Cvel_2556.t1 / gene=Cvel_2556 / organism=Chromera_velia_CCMP2878 / gene_product=hypothetical protein / transcript_product=hypothetical protein / location=Cvel_scaffold101:35771-38500(-) / protein_length=358 / sequence_SO=supercontig / SO=protein_coding / is_pseudo=false